MDLGIEGRTALVHGAGGGLGGAIAMALSREGVNVVAADLRGDAAEATAAAVRQQGGDALALQWDLGNLEVIDERLSSIESEFGGVDILVNNTGGPPPTPVSGVEADIWQTHFTAMVLSVVSTTDRVLGGMRERGWGRIITSASSGVVSPIPNLGLSNTLRASLVAWSKTLAREVGGDGITSNIVVPGRIGTARTASLDESKAEREGRSASDIAAESAASIPVGRYGTPEEYAAAVTFLASSPASYVTGSVVRVDGGLIPSI